MDLKISKITVYPIKSLPGTEVKNTILTPASGLKWDRKWALRYSDGRYLNGKHDQRIHLVRAQFDLVKGEVSLAFQNSEFSSFSLENYPAIGKWFSHFWNEEIHLTMAETHFGDDQKAPGPTLISSASLLKVGSWFGIEDLGELRRRFRTNLEIEGCPPFWEDSLLNRKNGRFKIGKTLLRANNVCKRCIVPSRNPETGEHIKNFSKIFSTHRRNELPESGPAFDHFYRLAINTTVPDQPGPRIIKMNDLLSQ